MSSMAEEFAKMFEKRVKSTSPEKELSINKNWDEQENVVITIEEKK